MAETALYLFDGYNLLHAGSFRDARELVDRLADFVAVEGARGVVVFDGVGEDASYGPLELSTEWWRLFTAMFVHIGVIHIALNMYCLWSLGPLAERLFGRWKFLSLYLLSGVGGNVLSVALHPTLVAAGASGAWRESGGGSLSTMARMRSVAVAPSNGARPAIIS